MSPRDSELLDGARARLRAARANLEIGEFDVAVSTAYYAMLYAARSALSSRELQARTHSGTWHVFRRELVRHGHFDAALATAAAKAQ